MKPYLRIEKPCEELLENMHDVSGGKFCDLCSKKVYDLTNLTHSEIADIIEQNNGEKFCGILIKKQPENSFENKIQFSENFQPRKATFSKIAAGVALTASIINHFPAQTKSVSKTEIKTPQKKSTKENQKKENKTENGNFIISGKIISDKTGKPVIAEVHLITIFKVYSTKTDEKGLYALEVPKEVIKTENLLEFSPDPYSFDQKLIIFQKTELTKNNTIKLVENDNRNVLGDISVIPPSATENSLVFLHGKRMDYKLFNKSLSLYWRKYDVHYIPKPFTKFFTSNENIDDIFITFTK